MEKSDLLIQLGKAFNTEQAARYLKAARNKCDRCGSTDDNLYLPGFYICDKCESSWQINPQTD